MSLILALIICIIVGFIENKLSWWQTKRHLGKDKIFFCNGGGIGRHYLHRHRSEKDHRTTACPDGHVGCKSQPVTPIPRYINFYEKWIGKDLK